MKYIKRGPFPFTCDICGEEGESKQPSGKYHEHCRKSEAYKEMVRMKGQRLTDRGQFVVFERDDFQCVYCGQSSVEDGVRLHCDHILAKALGGTDAASNLVTACEDCNLTKGSQLLAEPVQERIYSLVQERNERRSILPDLLIRSGRTYLPS